MDIAQRRGIVSAGAAVFLLGMAVGVKADVSFSGELRLRPEYFNNADFNKATKDTQSSVGSRLRVTGSGLAAENIALKFTFQDTRNFGGEFNANTNNPNSNIGLTDSGEMLDVHEAFVDFQNFLGPISFRAGRQELSYGDQRLVGSFGWNNQGRAFDGFKAYYVGGFMTLDAWTVKRKENNPVPPVTTPAPTPPLSAAVDKDFSGVYATFKPVYPGGLLDLYFLHDREGDLSTASTAKPKNLFTAGARLAGKHGPLDYTVEAPYQFGNNGAVTAAPVTQVKVSAKALAAKAGWTVDGNAELRVGGEYDYASGDKNAADKKAKTFQNLYPTNHPFYGYMDYQGWRNMKAWSGVASFKPTRRTFLLAQYWDFSLDQAHDAWYAAAGTAVGAARTASATGTNKHVGKEVDVLFRFVQSRLVIWEAGYGRFMRGHFIKARFPGGSKDSDWAYVMSTVKF